MQAITTILDLLTGREFLVGAAAGLLVVVFLASRSSPRGWGLGFTGAAFVAIFFIFGVRDGLAVTITLLAVGGWLLARPSDRGREGGPAIAQIGGWALVGLGSLAATTIGGLEVSFLVRLTTPALALVGGLLLRAWATLPARALLGPLFAISVLGVWATVPETQLARVLVGVAVLMSVTTLPPINATITWPGAFALAGLFVWAMLVAGNEREASIAGAWASLGALVLIPLLPSRSPTVRSGSLIVAHTALVIVASRLIGLRESYAPALIASLLLLSAGYAYFWLTTGDRHDL